MRANFGMVVWPRDELLRAVIEQAPGYVVLLEGPELIVTYANPAAGDLMRHDLVGRSFRDVYRGTAALEVIERAYATGRVETISEQPLLIEGRDPSRLFTRTATPLKDEDGTVQALLLNAREVTADVRDRQAHQASRAELQRMFAFFEDAPVILAVLEPPDWKLTLANRALRTVIGERFVGASIRALLPTQNRTLAAIDRIYETGRAESFETVAELEGYAGRAFSISMLPVRNDDGNVGHIMCAAIELTEHRRACHELEAQARDLELARQQAVAAGRAKDQFLAMLGHELRNPLQPMLTAVQVMRLDGEKSLALDMLEGEVKYLTRLVDDLLDVSRISRSQVRLDLEPLAIRSIVDRGLELASPLLEQRRHRVTIDLEPGLAVSGDRQRLAQVVSNLVQNAAKYSAPGSQIRIRAERNSGRVTLRIADDGIGIAKDMLATIFEAFVQASQSLARTAGGLGIGLAIVRSLVEAHGGVISAHSDGPGRGSVFVVELPAIDLVPSTLVKRAAHGVHRRDRARSRVHVLVVDDNIEATIILETGLAALGFQVSIANDGPSALELASLRPPQIALLDIGLPVMDGYQLGELLRAAHSIPLVAITGYGQEVDRQRSRAAGFAAHLVKPVDLGDLVELIDKLALADNPTV